MITKDQLIEVLIKAVPYPHQIKDIDSKQDGSIYFVWKSTKYKVELWPIMVWEVKVCELRGSDNATLMERLIKNKIGEIL